MKGYLLLVPFILIRFVLLSLIDKNALKRATYFPPLIENEKIAYFVYQISNIGIFVYMFFLKIHIEKSILFYVSLIIYLIGVLLLALSVVNFAKPSEDGINLNGIYKFSRNPIYVSYFVFFMGCVMLTKSLILLGLLLSFQISAHWIIISEERWCINKFGEKYLDYMKNVRRYI